MTRNDASGDYQNRINRRFMREYAFYLQDELDAYVRPDDGTSLYRHAMLAVASPVKTIVTVQFVLRTRFDAWVEDTASLGFTIFRKDGQATAYQFTEKPLSDPELGVHLYEGDDDDTMLNICHLSEPHSWSNVQAFQDSSDAISLILAQRCNFKK